MSGHVDVDRLPPRLQPKTPPDVSCGEVEEVVVVQRGISPMVLLELLDFIAAARDPLARSRRLEVARFALRKPLVDESLSDVAARIGTSKQFVDKLKQQFERVATESHERHRG